MAVGPKEINGYVYHVAVAVAGACDGGRALLVIRQVLTLDGGPTATR